MSKNTNKLLLFLCTLVLMSSCKFYKQDIMFKTDKSIDEGAFREAVAKASKGYRLRKGDVVSFKLFTNKGEVMIDPNYDLARQLGSGKGSAAEGAGSFTTQSGSAAQMSYVIDYKGIVMLPMIGKLQVDSLTQNQFDSVLSVKYAAYYQDPFVVSSVNSKQVIILNGKFSKIIPIGNKNINLIEALANLTNAEEHSKVSQIRIIRGDLRNPSVMLVDLSTIEGLKKAELTLLPDDIVYLEPGRSATRDSLKDYVPYLNIFVSFFSIFLVLSR